MQSKGTQVDSSDLYTGANSGSFGNYRATKLKQKASEDKEQKKGKLIPAYELIIGAIDKEIADVKSIEFLLVDIQTPDEHLKAELVARRRYIGYLTNLKSTLKNTLKEKK